MLPTIVSRCQPVLFAPLAETDVAKLLQTYAPEVTEPARAAHFGGGSVSGALQAAEALELLESGGFGTVTGPAQVAAQLSRTAATARKEAHGVLDVLISALHTQWAASNKETRPALQSALTRFENYKRHIGRNVSPALVLETALMSLDGLDVKL